MQTLLCEIEGLKKYEIKIWESGCCKYLANVKFIDGKGYWDYSGTTNIRDYIRITKNDGISEGLIKVIRAIRKITEGFVSAEDYLVSDKHISMDIEKLWFDTKEGIIKLVPGQSDRAFIARIEQLLTELSFEDIAEKIEEQNKTSAMSYKDLLSFLSLFELELR